MNNPTQPTYFVALLQTALSSLDEVRQTAPDALSEHLQRSRQLHAEGKLLMAGAFLEPADGPISTMAILPSREAAEAFVEGDPFVRLGLVESSEIREWANILRPAEP
jgi:uncharacterized protein YciI